MYFCHPLHIVTNNFCMNRTDGQTNVEVDIVNQMPLIRKREGVKSCYPQQKKTVISPMGIEKPGIEKYGNANQQKMIPTHIVYSSKLTAVEIVAILIRFLLYKHQKCCISLFPFHYFGLIFFNCIILLKLPIMLSLPRNNGKHQVEEERL